MEATLLAKSSSGDSYQVEFVVDGESVRIFCNCPAGAYQQVCKHKLAMIRGDATILFDPAQIVLLTEIRSWPQFARLITRVNLYEREIAEIQTAKAALSKREKAAKALMAREMAGEDGEGRQP